MDAEWVGVGWYCPDDGSGNHNRRTKWMPCLDGNSPGAKYFKKYSYFKEYKQRLRLIESLKPKFINGFNKKKKSNRRKRKR